MATTAAATLVVKVIADTKNAAAGLDTASGKVGKFQGALSKAAIPAAIAGAAIIKFGSDAVESASRLQQAMGGVDAVFGRNAGVIEKWATGAATSVGLAKSEYGELAAVIGAQLKNAGLPLDEATKKTGSLIKVGADLAATYGGTTKEAVEALGAALRGEADPAERYGLALSQTRVQAELAKKGMDDLTGTALAQAKAQTVVELATKQAGGAVGQFAREQDSAAGSAQIAAAQWENAKAALGTALLPVVAAVTSKLAGMAKWMGENTKTVQILVGVVGSLSAAVFILIGALKVYEAVTKAVGIIQKATWLASPIGLVVLAVVAVGVALFVLYKKSKTFRDFVNKMWAGIKAATRAAAEVFKAAWRVALAVIGALVRRYGGVFKTVWRAAVFAVKAYVGVLVAYFKLVFNVIKGVVKLVVAVFKGDWRGALDAVKGIVRAFGSFFRSIFNLLPDPVKRAAEAVRNALGRAFDWLKSKASALGDVLSKPFNAMRDAVDAVVGAVQDLVGWLDNIHVPDLGKIGGLVSKIPGLGRAAAPTVAAPSVAAFGAPRVRGGGLARSGASAGGGPTIVVNGALDPEATARQIQRILAGHDRRVGLRTA